MVRGVIFGSLAFAAAFAGERQLRGLLQDMKRYDRLRRMSGDSSFLHEQLDTLFTLLRKRANLRRGAGFETLLGVQSDIRRYLRIRSM